VTLLPGGASGLGMEAYIPLIGRSADVLDRAVPVL